MMESRVVRRKRRLHKPEFKAKVALEAIKGELTMAEMVRKFDVQPTQITEWKKQLTMENDFLERGLERTHGPRGKKW